MISSDKIITLGLHTVIAGTLYSTFGSNLPTRALQWTGGGIAASAIFQAYFPDFGGLMKEKCGKPFTQAVLWLYPLLIPLGGYLGGLPQRTNLLVSVGYFCFHQLSYQTTREFALKRRLSDAAPLRLKAAEAIENGNLQKAAEKLEEVDRVVEAGADVGNKSIRDVETDRRKKALSTAFLNHSPPNIKEAEKWALAIRSDLTKFDALANLIRHLLRTNGDESKILRLLDTWGSINGSYAFATMNLKFEVAVRYKKPELFDEIKQTISTLKGSVDEMSALLFLLQKTTFANHSEVAKAALEKAKELVGELENENDQYKNCYYPVSGLFHGYFKRETPESEIIYLLVVFAGQMQEWPVVEELLKHPELSTDGRIAAQLETANAFGDKGQKAKMKEHINLADDLIANTRAVNEVALRQTWYTALFKVYLKFDPPLAFEIIKRLPQDHERMYLELALRVQDENQEVARDSLAKLTPIFKALAPEEQEIYAQLQAVLDPEVLFAACGEIDQLPGVIKDPSICTKVLLTLAEARLKRQEYDQADAIFRAITQDEPWVKHELKRLQSWPRVRRGWFSWTS